MEGRGLQPLQGEPVKEGRVRGQHGSGSCSLARREQRCGRSRSPLARYISGLGLACRKSRSLGTVPEPASRLARVGEGSGLALDTDTVGQQQS